jgi:trans-aconitate 2-methyltransferase
MAAMSDWNPALYSRFEDERTRPAAELLGRVFLDAPARVVDLGCGPGNSTELLLKRHPQAGILGIDNSDAMLGAARQRLPGLRFEPGDIATWAPEVPWDLVYANASLQWVPDHPALFPRLLSALHPGGVLAVQMPDNLDQPSHVLMRETARGARFAPFIGDPDKLRARVLSAERYYDLLAALSDVDVWRTTYHHVMDGASSIVQWVRATGLKPFVEALPDELQPAFLQDYESRIDAAYPARSDGKRLLAFPRLFIVARRRG